MSQDFFVALVIGPTKVPVACRFGNDQAEVLFVYR